MEKTNSGSASFPPGDPSAEGNQGQVPGLPPSAAPGNGASSFAADLLLLILLFSGTAGLINQVVWQRALKIYLAGAEALSSMVVVLVFMLGLGIGSLVVGFWSPRVGNPLRWLGRVEGLLGLVNLFVCWILTRDIGDSIYAFQRLAVSFGIDLTLIYLFSALVILLLPCFLMGATMPLASEAAQRQLHRTESWFVDHLFFANTLGAFLGTLVSGYLLLPWYGQTRTLALAAAGNLLAAILALHLSRSREGTPRASEDDPAGSGLGGKIKFEEWLGFWLGFVSLGYEMYLFRIAALAWEPLPITFAAVLAYFLFLWSAGVFLAGKTQDLVGPLLAVCGLLIAIAPFIYHFDRFLAVDPASWWGSAICFLPCLCFGFLYGQLLNRTVARWGPDVGRFAGLNTLGCCLGIVTMTFLGLRLYTLWNAWALALLMLILWAQVSARTAPSWRGGHHRASEAPVSAPTTPSMTSEPHDAIRGDGAGLLPPSRSEGGPGREGNPEPLSPGCGPGVPPAGERLPPFLGARACRALTLAGIVGIGCCLHYGLEQPQILQNLVAYSNASGVVEIRRGGGLYWDGLWHSSLSDGENHKKSPNWLLAVLPLCCHPRQDIQDALVIGLGSGITAATLARTSAFATVDCYEINRGLARVMNDFPEGTLFVGTNPKIRLLWQDARAGLALNEKRYDLITQAPLWLKQAGSTILLSQEYLRLLKTRLKDDGVVCIYANSRGNRTQNLLVEKTVRSVFKHCLKFMKGYLFVAADVPLTFSRQSLEARYLSDDPLWREVREVSSLSLLLDTLCPPDDSWKAIPWLVTDDHPLLEYPELLEEAVPAPDGGLAPGAGGSLGLGKTFQIGF